ncbi:MAG: sulfite reductase [NADPH] flavoprotein alpha-component, partial [Pseudomonadota bacterium]
AALKTGALTKLSVAFSRDQARKIYVQDRIRENAAEIWAWLEEGAHLYICGDANKMARDVQVALEGLIAQEGGRSPEEAAAYLAELRDAKRFQRDVY